MLSKPLRIVDSMKAVVFILLEMTSTFAFVSQGFNRCSARKLHNKNSFCMQVWSNSQAVEDYKNLLAGKSEPRTFDCASVIIGKGNVGSALCELGFEGDVLLDGGDSIPESLVDNSGKILNSFPIYVTVDESDLEEVLKNCPKEKKEDLVFLQRGCIEPLLKRYGVCRKEQTQAVLYWKFREESNTPMDGIVDIGMDKFGESKYAGETCVCGKWSGALKDRLDRKGLTCTMLFYNEWRRNMYERIIFDSAFNLVGALHGYPTIGYVARYYAQEVDDLIYELGRSLRATFAVTMLLGIEERLMTYAEEIENNTQTTMNPEDFDWRNGFFYKYVTLQARKANFPDPCEQHSLYLEYGRDNGLFVLPPIE